MRMLASFGVFKEGPQRHFALTPVGDLLKTGAPGSLRYMAMMFGEDSRPAPMSTSATVCAAAATG